MPTRNKAICLFLASLLGGCSHGLHYWRFSANVERVASPQPTPFQAAAALKQCTNGGVPPKIKFHPQETDVWCWAASAQMVREFFGESSIEQCALANDFFQRKDCCPTATAPKECIQTGWPPLGDHLEFTMTTDAALSPDDIVEELGKQKRPFIFSWHDDGGSGHIMVAIDFATTKLDGDVITVEDPWSSEAHDRRDIPYSIYKSGIYKHWNDFYDIERK